MRGPLFVFVAALLKKLSFVIFGGPEKDRLGVTDNMQFTWWWSSGSSWGGERPGCWGEHHPGRW